MTLKSKLKNSFSSGEQQGAGQSLAEVTIYARLNATHTHDVCVMKSKSVGNFVAKVGHDRIRDRFLMDR